ncbi:Ferrous iron transport permease EfeU [Streptococcus sp. DD12]|nr:Ferrous iron transport permease EfeU [Streptococcus sp. DD12]
MDKHSLTNRWLKIWLLLSLSLLCFLTRPVFANVDSSLYIKITDATTAVENGDQTKAKDLVADIKDSFEAMANHDSKAGKKVSQALTIKGKVTKNN